ncbi:MAG: T9SS type A sorting domain-containing protein, partial [Flavobacteriales bacterium]|nr:T9SS type A sorting domain-containing protein [Flavobacteriales bacterium]
QKFYNYYAYDDGTAELAYGLGNLETVGRVAMKYNIKADDVLRSIQLYLNPVGEDISQEPVQLAVWSGNDEPVDMLWTSPEISLSFSSGRNYFYHYFLDQEIEVAAGDNIWVGWIQQPVSDVIFSVGFDKRTDASDKLFYNLGTNWTQSSIPGAVMIRPVFGEQYNWQVGIEEQTAETISVYPNPTTGQLYLNETYSGQFSNADISLFDLTGRKVLSENGYRNSLKIDFLRAGTYILRVETQQGKLLTQRIILQP